MPIKKEPEPNRLLESGCVIVNFERSRVGYLHLDTDEGEIVLAINSTVAGALASTLIEFLSIREEDYHEAVGEEPANDS